MCTLLYIVNSEKKKEKKEKIQDKTVEYPQTAVSVNGPSRCSRIQDRTHTRHAHDQDTAVIPIPMKHPTCFLPPVKTVFHGPMTDDVEDLNGWP